MSITVNHSDFKIEETKTGAKITGVHESLLQESEKDILWYRDNFFGKDHTNFLTTESPRGPMAVSMIFDKDMFKILLRTETGSERITIAARNVRVPWYRKLLGLPPSVTDVLGSYDANIPTLTLRPSKDPDVAKELLAMEERQVIRSYKFGLVYVAPGQSNEEEMFGNRLENVSQQFHQFLNFLGEKIELKGWKGYRAGLDVNDNQTGTHSIYTKWQGYEIMFHVAVMLPYNNNDKQQLEKKRHIGNDIVMIVFQDSDTPFQVSTITSKQNHVLAVVKPQGDGYNLTIASKQGVPAFTPDLPDKTHFERNAVSRDFFLHKLVNGERACYRAPSFAPKISRTRAILLADVADRFLAGQ